MQEDPAQAKATEHCANLNRASVFSHRKNEPAAPMNCQLNSKSMCRNLTGYDSSRWQILHIGTRCTSFECADRHGFMALILISLLWRLDVDQKEHICTFMRYVAVECARKWRFEKYYVSYSTSSPITDHDGEHKTHAHLFTSTVLVKCVAWELCRSLQYRTVPYWQRMDVHDAIADTSLLAAQRCYYTAGFG